MHHPENRKVLWRIAIYVFYWHFVKSVSLLKIDIKIWISCNPDSNRSTWKSKKAARTIFSIYLDPISYCLLKNKSVLPKSVLKDSSGNESIKQQQLSSNRNTSTIDTKISTKYKLHNQHKQFYSHTFLFHLHWFSLHISDHFAHLK